LLWSFKGKSKVVRYPADENQWIRSSDPAVSLIPPLIKEYIELDADRQQFATDSVASVNVSFASVQGGDKKVIRSVILRSGDQGSTTKTAVYHDPGAPVVYQTTWYSKEKGQAKPDLAVLSSNYLFLASPPSAQFKR
jgi:hypothetical protein